MQATFDHVVDEAENIKTFWFKPDKPTRYTAGQFIELTIFHDNADKRGQKRWFTLSSSPTEEMLSVTTKFALENGSTFKQAMQSLQAGQIVRMSEAMGDFVLPKDASKPVIFVAGGIGVTPMRSMIKDMVDKAGKRDVTLLYSAKSGNEFAFTELFKHADITYTPIVSGDDPKWQGERGYVTAEAILAIQQTKAESYIYLSGPEPMIQALVADMKKQGVDKKRLVTDYFPGYTTT